MISAGSPIIQKQERHENVLNTKPELKTERISKTIPRNINLKFKIMKVLQYMNNAYVYSKSYFLQCKLILRFIEQKYSFLL